MIDVSLGDRVARLPASTAATLYPNRETWLQARRAVIGASDVAKMEGLSPYGGPWSIWASKVFDWSSGGSAHVKETGLKWEARTLSDFEEISGCSTYGPLGTMIVRGPGQLGVTLDAFVREGDEVGIGECKLADPRANYMGQRYRWGRSGTVIEAWTDDCRSVVREDYAAQVYTQLAATGLPWAYLIVRISMYDLRWFKLMADPRTQDGIVRRTSQWWRDHVVGNMPPDVDDSEACREALVRMFPPRDLDGIREADAYELELVRRYFETKREIERLESLKAELGNKLAEGIGRNTAIQFERDGKGPGFVRWNPRKGRSTLDRKRLEADHPGLLSDYTIEGRETRGLTFPREN